jgi:alkaline phosphatase D
MIGDNIYADTSNPEVFRAKYEQFGNHPDFKEFRATRPILATWDDHDYGLNDGGSDFPGKHLAKNEFINFWNIPKTSPVHKQGGIYHSATFGPLNQRVQVILLDTRFFRGPLVKSKGGYVANPDPKSSMLGQEQWQWLEGQLLEPANLRIIVSSIQFVAEGHPYEKWSNLPLEKQRFLDLIKKTKANGVVLISGDRHHGELSKLPKQKTGFYDLYDLTSSGMTEKSQGYRDEWSAWRVSPPKPYFGDQYGEIKIDWQGKSGPLVSLLLRNSRQEILASSLIKLADLKPTDP